jgi:poly-gamma-glutamate synthesis protein (capsule biosynthesis protein)
MLRYLFKFSILLVSSATILISCDKDELSICFTGDLMLDRGVREQINRKGADALFADVSSLFATYDAVVVNLECPVTTRNTPISKQYVFRAAPEYLAALRRAGITHSALANNHTNDHGRHGVEDTYNYLKTNDITPLGAGSNATEACSPIFINKGKISVALLNSVLVPLESWPYLSDAYGVCQASIDELCKKIQDIKEAKQDCRIVVILHWGAEYSSSPTPLQRFYAQKLIDAGADAIIGHHPHVVQPTETYKNKPVFYSLGNFIFDAKREDANQGILAGLTFTKEGVTAAKVHCYEIKRCIPIIKHCEKSEKYETRIFPSQ